MKIHLDLPWGGVLHIEKDVDIMGLVIIGAMVAFVAMIWRLA